MRTPHLLEIAYLAVLFVCCLPIVFLITSLDIGQIRQIFPNINPDIILPAYFLGTASIAFFGYIIRRWNNNIHEWGKSGIISTLADLETRTELLERRYSLLEVSDLEKRIRNLENRDIDIWISDIEKRVCELERCNPDIGILRIVERASSLKSRLFGFCSTGLKEKVDDIAEKVGNLENKTVN